MLRKVFSGCISLRPMHDDEDGAVVRDAQSEASGVPHASEM